MMRGDEGEGRRKLEEVERTNESLSKVEEEIVKGKAAQVQYMVSGTRILIEWFVSKVEGRAGPNVTRLKSRGEQI